MPAPGPGLALADGPWPHPGAPGVKAFAALGQSYIFLYSKKALFITNHILDMFLKISLFDFHNHAYDMHLAALEPLELIEASLGNPKVK